MTLFRKKSVKAKKYKDFHYVVYKCKCGLEADESLYYGDRYSDAHLSRSNSICTECGAEASSFKRTKKIKKVEI